MQGCLASDGCLNLRRHKTCCSPIESGETFVMMICTWLTHCSISNEAEVRRIVDTERRGKRYAQKAARVLWWAAIAVAVVAVSGVAAPAQDATVKPLYLDASQPIGVRVDDLMQRMTLKEKLGQLNLPCAYVDDLGKTNPEK